MKWLTWLSVATLTLIVMTGFQTQSTENFLFVNYLGQEINLDLNDVSYTIPGTGTHPDGGRLTLTLNPGEHKFAVTTADGEGSAGIFDLAEGQFIAKAAILRPSAPLVDSEGVLRQAPGQELHVFDFDPNAPAEEPDSSPVDTWQPAAPAPGQGSLAWVNYWGRDELTVDLQGQVYKVPPATELPGVAQFDVAPGTYNYTVSVPNGSTSGEINVAPGQVIGLGVSGSEAPREYDVGDDYVFLPPVTLTVDPQDITARIDGVVPTPTPMVTPTATITPTPTLTSTTSPTGTSGILIKNFVSQVLTVDINNQIYEVGPNAERVIALSPGEYSYSASVPGATSSRVVEVVAGEQVVISIARIDDMLESYLEVTAE